VLPSGNFNAPEASIVALPLIINVPLALIVVLAIEYPVTGICSIYLLLLQFYLVKKKPRIATGLKNKCFSMRSITGT
jgi:hypothetical protein